MKRQIRPFTLVELMFVIGILVILIGITWVVGSKILQEATLRQTKAELKMLHASVDSYKSRFGVLPWSENSTDPAAANLNFVEYLSSVKPNESTYSGDKRAMFAEFRTSSMNISTDDYDDINPTIGATASDTYNNPYLYDIDFKGNSDPSDDTFYIFSVGRDGIPNNEDDVRSDE